MYPMINWCIYCTMYVLRVFEYVCKVEQQNISHFSFFFYIMCIFFSIYIFMWMQWKLNIDATNMLSMELIPFADQLYLCLEMVYQDFSVHFLYLLPHMLKWNLLFVNPASPPVSNGLHTFLHIVFNLFSFIFKFFSFLLLFSV